MTKRPVAYIRRSSPDERRGAGEVSRDVQEDAIRSLAHRDGYNGDVEYFVDWGRSADESKVGRRAEYLRMLRLIEAGGVSVVYAYALDRLNRSLVLSARFAAACEANGVRIVTQREGEVRQDTPDEWLRWTILATFANYELKVMKTRAAANIARRRVRGDDLGYAPYGMVHDPSTHKLVARDGEDVSAVVEAYERAGSFGGAAALLNGGAPDLAERARPRRGERWSDLTVARVVRRAGAAPKAAARGWSRKRAEAAAETFPLYRLIACPHDGSRLIGMRTKSGNGKSFNRYFCGRARNDPSHPRPYAIAESIVLPWVEERIEGRRRVVRTERIEAPTDAAAQRAELERKRKLLGVALVDETITPEEYAARKEAIDAALAELPTDDDAAALTVTFSTGSPRGLIERIDLGADMRPTEVRWRTA